MVLDAALEVYLERGYRGTSMQAVADACGVTKPVVYECFRNKDEMLMALLDREEQRLVAAATAALPAEPQLDDLEGAFAERLAAFFAGVQTAPQSWRVIFDSQHGADTAVATRVRQARAGVIEQVRRQVSASLSAASVDDVGRKSVVVAELLVSVVEACTREFVLAGDAWETPDLARYVAKLLARGVGSA